MVGGGKVKEFVVRIWEGLVRMYVSNELDSLGRVN